MTVEAATYPPDLDTTLPPTSDFLIEGPAHLKLIKGVVKNAFPNVAGAVTADHAELNKLDGLTGTILSTGTPVSGQWVLMSSVDTSAVAAIDFVSGVGSVVINSTYDEWLLVVMNALPGTAASSLRLQTSDDGGTSWASCVGNAQSAVIASGAQTLTNHSALGYFPVTGNQTTTAALFAQIVITRNTAATMSRLGVYADFQQEGGTKGGIVRGQIDDTNSINAFRLAWSAGNWSAANGQVRLYGRKA